MKTIQFHIKKSFDAFLLNLNLKILNLLFSECTFKKIDFILRLAFS